MEAGRGVRSATNGKGPVANHRPLVSMRKDQSSDEEFDELFDEPLELEFDEEFELELEDEFELELLDEFDELLELELFDELDDRFEPERSEEFEELLLLEFDQLLPPVVFFPPEMTDLKNFETLSSACAGVCAMGAATSIAPRTANTFFICDLLYGNLVDCGGVTVLAPSYSTCRKIFC